VGYFKSNDHICTVKRKKTESNTIYFGETRWKNRKNKIARKDVDEYYFKYRNFQNYNIVIIKKKIQVVELMK